RGGLSARDAVLRGTVERNPGLAADRVHQDSGRAERRPSAMSTVASAGRARPDYLSDGYGLKSWLLTRDHKRIALLYLFSITFFFVLGGIFALLIRLELLTPAGDLVSSQTYNKLFTMHGVIMVFFFLIPSIPAVLGNFLIPLMIGARDLAFPRIN